MKAFRWRGLRRWSRKSGRLDLHKSMSDRGGSAPSRRRRGRRGSPSSYTSQKACGHPASRPDRRPPDWFASAVAARLLVWDQQRSGRGDGASAATEEPLVLHPASTSNDELRRTNSQMRIVSTPFALPAARSAVERHRTSTAGVFRAGGARSPRRAAAGGFHLRGARPWRWRN